MENLLSETDSEICPICLTNRIDGTRLKMVPGRGLVPCDCRGNAEARKFYAGIPQEFGVPRFAEIKGDPRRHPQQPRKLEAIRDNPDDSYFIYGSNGTGKSFLGWAISVHAAEQGRRVVACELDTLLKQYRRSEFAGHDEQRPSPFVTADELRRSRRRWTIFLDEIGATTPTEYAAKEFLALVKAAVEGGHQMIYTCNVTPEKLQSHWSRQDEAWGNSICRRIGDYSTQVNLFR